jgi:hypothetical protein
MCQANLGTTAWSFALLDKTQWIAYLAYRQSRGVNVLWVTALCAESRSVNGKGGLGELDGQYPHRETDGGHSLGG